MGGDAKGYRGLLAWQKGMDLCTAVYALMKRMPETERFGLIQQMQRAVVSIPSNIAEGYARGDSKDYPKHLRYALGSLAELETQLEIAIRNDMLPRDAVKPTWALAQETGRLLTGLVQSKP